MTVAIAVKVFDGLVLAADSATTLPLPSGGAQVYNNADKIFHLHRDEPLAAMTWGTGNIGSASISTLAKDLRRRLMGRDPEHPDWKIGDAWTIEQVAERVVEMFHRELWVAEWPDASDSRAGQLGLLLAGYSSGEKQAEAWQLTLGGTASPVASQVIDLPTSGWLAFAQSQAMQRLFNGYDETMAQRLRAAGPHALGHEIESVLRTSRIQPVIPAMPFADAIQLARFMAETTATFNHYVLGPDTVGGAIEVAAINRHEGFKWISRKHYYPPELNPWGAGHDV